MFTKKDLIEEKSNLIDKREEIKTNLAKVFTKLSFFECSSKTSEKVMELFCILAIKILNKFVGLNLNEMEERWIPGDEKSMKMWKKELRSILVLFLCCRKMESSLFSNFPKPLLFLILSFYSQSFLIEKKFEEDKNEDLNDPNIYQKTKWTPIPFTQNQISKDSKKYMLKILLKISFNYFIWLKMGLISPLDFEEIFQIDNFLF